MRNKTNFYTNLYFIGGSRRPKNFYRFSKNVSWKMWFRYRKSQVKDSELNLCLF